jgi:hypothetical protein
MSFLLVKKWLNMKEPIRFVPNKFAAKCLNLIVLLLFR